MGKNSLLIIDPQIDFHPEGGHGDLYHPPGSLAVPGANEDSQRTADFIRDHINDLDDIFVTLDSHHVCSRFICYGLFVMCISLLEKSHCSWYYLGRFTWKRPSSIYSNLQYGH